MTVVELSLARSPLFSPSPDPPLVRVLILFSFGGFGPNRDLYSNLLAVSRLNSICFSLFFRAFLS